MRIIIYSLLFLYITSPLQAITLTLCGDEAKNDQMMLYKQIKRHLVTYQYNAKNYGGHADLACLLRTYFINDKHEQALSKIYRNVLNNGAEMLMREILQFAKQDREEPRFKALPEQIYLFAGDQSVINHHNIYKKIYCNTLHTFVSKLHKEIDYQPKGCPIEATEQRKKKLFLHIEKSNRMACPYFYGDIEYQIKNAEDPYTFQLNEQIENYWQQLRTQKILPKKCVRLIKSPDTCQYPGVADIQFFELLRLMRRNSQLWSLEQWLAYKQKKDQLYSLRKEKYQGLLTKIQCSNDLIINITHDIRAFRKLMAKHKIIIQEITQKYIDNGDLDNAQHFSYQLGFRRLSKKIILYQQQLKSWGAKGNWQFKENSLFTGVLADDFNFLISRLAKRDITLDLNKESIALQQLLKKNGLFKRIKTTLTQWENDSGSELWMKMADQFYTQGKYWSPNTDKHATFYYVQVFKKATELKVKNHALLRLKNMLENLHNKIQWLNENEFEKQQLLTILKRYNKIQEQFCLVNKDKNCPYRCLKPESNIEGTIDIQFLNNDDSPLMIPKGVRFIHSDHKSTLVTTTSWAISVPLLLSNKETTLTYAWGESRQEMIPFSLTYNQLCHVLENKHNKLLKIHVGSLRPYAPLHIDVGQDDFAYQWGELEAISEKIKGSIRLEWSSDGQLFATQQKSIADLTQHDFKINAPVSLLHGYYQLKIIIKLGQKKWQENIFWSSNKRRIKLKTPEIRKIMAQLWLSYQLEQTVLEMLALIKQQPILAVNIALLKRGHKLNEKQLRFVSKQIDSFLASYYRQLKEKHEITDITQPKYLLDKIHNIETQLCDATNEAKYCSSVCQLPETWIHLNDSNNFYQTTEFKKAIRKQFEKSNLQYIHFYPDNSIHLLLLSAGQQKRFTISTLPSDEDSLLEIKMSLTPIRKSKRVRILFKGSEENSMCHEDKMATIGSRGLDKVNHFGNETDFLAQQIKSLINNPQCNRNLLAKPFQIRLTYQGNTVQPPQGVALMAMDSKSQVKQWATKDNQYIMELNANHLSINYIFTTNRQKQNIVQRIAYPIPKHMMCQKIFSDRLKQRKIHIALRDKDYTTAQISIKYERQLLSRLLEAKDYSNMQIHAQWFDGERLLAEGEVNLHEYDLIGDDYGKLLIKSDNKLLLGKYDVQLSFSYDHHTYPTTRRFQWWPHMLDGKARLGQPEWKMLGLLGKQKANFQGNNEKYLAKQIAERHFFQEIITEENIGWEVEYEGKWPNKTRFQYASAILYTYHYYHILPFLPYIEGKEGIAATLLKAYAIYFKDFEHYPQIRNRQKSYELGLKNLLNQPFFNSGIIVKDKNTRHAICDLNETISLTGTSIDWRPGWLQDITCDEEMEE